MNRPSRTLILTSALLFPLFACGSQSSRHAAAAEQAPAADGGLSLAQPDLGSAYASANWLDVALAAAGAASPAYHRQIAYQPGAPLKLDHLVKGDYTLTIQLLQGSTALLQGQLAVTIKAGVSTVATIEMEDVANASTGDLVVIVKKAGQPSGYPGHPTPGQPAPTDACALAHLAIPALCQISPARHCTYSDKLADGTTKTYDATQQTCGDLDARGEIYGQLCDAQRPFIAAQLQCVDI